MAEATFPLDNNYQAPAAELLDDSNSDIKLLHVVSVKKLIILQTLTLGLYAIYWFYKNYKLIKTTDGSSIWPAMRAIFQVFFTFSLFKRIHETADAKGIEANWSYSSMAAAYIVANVLSNVADSVSAMAGLLYYLMIPIIVYVLVKVQVTANAIAGDPQGESNEEFTWANYLWCVFGLFLWFAVIVESADKFGLINFY